MDAYDGIERNIVSQVGSGSGPSSAEIHRQLRVELAERIFPLCLALSYVYGSTLKVGPSLQYVLQRKKGRSDHRLINACEAVDRSLRFMSHEYVQFLQG